MATFSYMDDQLHCHPKVQIGGRSPIIKWENEYLQRKGKNLNPKQLFIFCFTLLGALHPLFALHLSLATQHHNSPSHTTMVCYGLMFDIFGLHA